MNTRLLLSSLAMTALLGATATSNAATASAAAPRHTDSDHAAAKAMHRGAHTQARADALDRLHMQVAAQRDVDQQRQIARGLRSGRLTPAQAAQLERAQAGILRHQAALERRGHESVDDALRMQHQQDLQDWAIHAMQASAGRRA
jgi:hypothetical protein